MDDSYEIDDHDRMSGELHWNMFVRADPSLIPDVKLADVFHELREMRHPSFSAHKTALMENGPMPQTDDEWAGRKKRTDPHEKAMEEADNEVGELILKIIQDKKITVYFEDPNGFYRIYPPDGFEIDQNYERSGVRVSSILERDFLFKAVTSKYKTFAAIHDSGDHDRPIKALLITAKDRDFLLKSAGSEKRRSAKKWAEGKERQEILEACTGWFYGEMKASPHFNPYGTMAAAYSACKNEHPKTRERVSIEAKKIAVQRLQAEGYAVAWTKPGIRKKDL